MNYDSLRTRIWDKQEKEMLYQGDMFNDMGYRDDLCYQGICCNSMIATYNSCDKEGLLIEICVYIPFSDRFVPMQCLGLKDVNKKLFYSGDVGKFSNGDTFFLMEEDWSEIGVQWIGEAVCEDQIRDLYRIGNAKIIANIWKHPEFEARILINSKER